MCEMNWFQGLWCWFTNNHEELRPAALLFVGLLGLGIAVWRARIADQQAAAARSQSETAEKNLINERSKSGVELLGHNSIAVRLGAIYALIEMADLYPESVRPRVAKMFQAHLTYPPTFASSRGEHFKGKVDYESPDTVEIINLTNPGRLKPYSDNIVLPSETPFCIENGKVKANPVYEDYEDWRYAEKRTPTYQP